MLLLLFSMPVPLVRVSPIPYLYWIVCRLTFFLSAAFTYEANALSTIACFSSEACILHACLPYPPYLASSPSAGPLLPQRCSHRRVPFFLLEYLLRAFLVVSPLPLVPAELLPQRIYPGAGGVCAHQQRASPRLPQGAAAARSEFLFFQPWSRSWCCPGSGVVVSLVLRPAWFLEERWHRRQCVAFLFRR